MTQTMIPSSTPPCPHVSGLRFGILIDVIAALLAPMFMGPNCGDISLARTAAIETVNAYRAQNLAELLAAAQIIAFGLAALRSLSLSMTEDVSPPMALRLRGNAIALNRSAEQNRRNLVDNQCVHDGDRPPEAECPIPPAANRDPDEQTGAEPFLSVAAARQLAAEAKDRLSDAERPRVLVPVPPPASVSAPAADWTTADKAAANKRHREIWAIAMVKEAEELSVSIPSLPPTERHAALIRAAALGGTANALLTGKELTPAQAARPHDPVPYQR